MHYLRKLFYSLAIVSLIAACGGGGGSNRSTGDNNPDPGSNQDSDQTAFNCNNGSCGYVYYYSLADRGYGYTRLDLSSGEYSYILGRPELGHGIGYSPQARGSDYFIAAFEDPDDDDPWGGNAFLKIFSKTQQPITFLRIDSRSYRNQHKISPDGTLIAFSNDYEQSELHNGTKLLPGYILFDLGKNVVKQLSDEMFGGYVTDLDWLPDGRLAVIGGRKIFVETEPQSYSFKPVYDFAEVGPVYNLSTSPIENRLAVAVGPTGSNPNNHVWVMDADGTNAYQLTTSDMYENAPTWSPDGKYILVQYQKNYRGITEAYAFARFFIVPSSIEKDKDGKRLAPIDLNYSPLSKIVTRLDSNGRFKTVTPWSDPEWRAD